LKFINFLLKGIKLKGVKLKGIKLKGVKLKLFYYINLMEIVFLTKLLLTILLVLLTLKSISGYKLLHYVNKFYAFFINDRELITIGVKICETIIKK
jgi:hypothetical protein